MQEWSVLIFCSSLIYSKLLMLFMNLSSLILLEGQSCKMVMWVWPLCSFLRKVGRLMRLSADVSLGTLPLA